MQPGEADDSIGLVYGAKSLDAQGMFGQPRTVAERGFAFVTGLCVDAIQRDHARL
jgi:hypothetical protein